MKKNLTSAELAEAWKAGQLPLRTAVRRHFKLVGLWPVNESLLFSLEMVLGFANLGRMETVIPLEDDQGLSVGEMIERYKLADFLG
jgi:hypothetical protein